MNHIVSADAASSRTGDNQTSDDISPSSIPGIPALPPQPRPGLNNDPQWYRTAVFYEALLRSFADSNGDGVGDFAGLTSRLDYLAWLGVDAIWIPPFYPSPMRDGGYDIADYTGVDPRYGTMDDFARLVQEAHARGIRIVIDMVLNHTSDAHPWFQASRCDPSGPYGDFYVWSDTDERYAGTRIIFIDTESSNWTWDEQRGQYFWHRFFSHQPDLNYDNPAVVEAVMDVVRFWARTGVDGFRLDAIPYLVEREGTSSENLPGTHAIVARLQAMLAEEFPGTITIAEANQMPHEVVEYFGTAQAPECTMCFHFPVMPRIFSSLREGHALPIRRVLLDTPDIPAHGQWGTFLRNHDELTLEMVSEEERAQMYAWYAPHERMRANVGIRRRLAPLLGGKRDELELAHALLLSLPGSPCLYYGDEIGMGDNMWLPDRDAVRTPMQWDTSAHMGFSTTTDADTLTLPLITDPDYAGVNVAAQITDPDSFLHWLRHLLAVRRCLPVLGGGTVTFLDCGNDAVLAHLRTDDAERVVCLANLSPQAQHASLTVPDAQGAHSVLASAEVSVRAEAERLFIELPPRGYCWLSLTPVHSGVATAKREEA